jgi:hypothetical protein
MKIATKQILGFFWIATLLYFSYLLLLLSLPYLEMKRDVDFLKTKQLIYHISYWRWSFYANVFSSIFVIVSGITQFLPRLIHNYKAVHRFFGTVYFSVLLLVAAPSGLIMSFYANGGWIAQIGFVGLSLAWIFTTLTSLYWLKRKNFLKHASWIARSYALTLAAISLRLYGYLFDVLKLEFHPVITYQTLAYLSWIPNLIVAEILIKRGLIQKLLKH